MKITKIKNKKKVQKFTCKPQLAYVDDVTCVETQLNQSKRLDFIISRKRIKSTIKLCTMFFLHKTNKNTQRKTTRGEMFCTFAGMTSLTPNSNNFVKSDQNATKLRASFFFHEIKKSMP